MRYGPLLLVVTLFAFALWVRKYFAKTRTSDMEAIEAFAKTRSLRIISVTRRDNYWHYWLRGRLFVSNIARVFVIVVESVEADRREIHVAFDNWCSSGDLQVLDEIPINS